MRRILRYTLARMPNAMGTAQVSTQPNIHGGFTARIVIRVLTWPFTTPVTGMKVTGVVGAVDTVLFQPVLPH